MLYVKKIKINIKKSHKELNYYNIQKWLESSNDTIYSTNIGYTRYPTPYESLGYGIYTKEEIKENDIIFKLSLQFVLHSNLNVTYGEVTYIVLFFALLTNSRLFFLHGGKTLCFLCSVLFHY